MFRIKNINSYINKIIIIVFLNKTTLFLSKTDYSKKIINKHIHNKNCLIILK